MASSVIFITGIDTDIGKSVVTGLFGRALVAQGKKVITQKVVQTGCAGLSQDILQHRRIMKMDLVPEDLDGTTCPYVFPEPCSPHLAASLSGDEIDCRRIDEATAALQKKYEYVLLEGVGGLLVPLNQWSTLIDYVRERDYPIVLVSSSRLGSINHTLSALEMIRQQGLTLKGIVYNCYPAVDPAIERDSREIFLKSLDKYGFPLSLVNCFHLDEYLSGRLEFQLPRAL